MAYKIMSTTHLLTGVNVRFPSFPLDSTCASHKSNNRIQIMIDAGISTISIPVLRLRKTVTNLCHESACLGLFSLAIRTNRGVLR